MRHGTRHGDFERRREAGREGEPRSKADPWREQQHPHSHRGRGGRGGPGRYGRGRAQRGDVRTAILLVLADQPMHGYQIMQAMGDRTGGAWRPSPGAVYPTIAQLEDEGLVTTQEEGGRRLVTLTPEGRTYVEERSARLGDPFADFASRGSGPQIEAAAKVLGQARRSLYLILAGESDDTGE